MENEYYLKTIVEQNDKILDKLREIAWLLTPKETRPPQRKTAFDEAMEQVAAIEAGAKPKTQTDNGK